MSYHTGKRDYGNTEVFIADVEQRIAGRIQITTDGWQPYPEIIRRYLLPRLNYAVMQKIYGQQDPNDINQNRRYSPPRCTGVRVEIVAGVPRKDRINTSFVERTNLTVRHFNKRFARLGLAGRASWTTTVPPSVCLLRCSISARCIIPWAQHRLTVLKSRTGHGLSRNSLRKPLAAYSLATHLCGVSIPKRGRKNSP